MMLNEFLSSRHIPFEQVHHDPAYAASRMAQVLHVPGKDVAKTVLLRTEAGYVIAVIPATHKVDLARARELLDAEKIAMAGEDEMTKLFPDCEPGAVPPFGSLYNLPTVVDESLAEDEQIVFEGNSHEEAIRMTYHDFQNVEHPRAGRFAYHI